jgi:hypothetical protein
MKAAKKIHGILIESGVPLPQSMSRRCRDVLGEMKLGDSILIPLIDREVWRRTAMHMGMHVCTRAAGTKNSRLWLVSAPKNGRPVTSRGRSK